MTTEKNLWLLTEEEEAEIESERKRELAHLNTIPEYRKSNDDRIYLCSHLTNLLFDELSEFDFKFDPSPKKPSQESMTYRQGKPERKSWKLLAFDLDGIETQVYRDFCEQRSSFIRLIRSYGNLHRETRWHTAADRNDPLYFMGSHNTEILQQGLKRGEKSFEVGSSLYVYQQMHDRNRWDPASLSKATWLLKTCYPTGFGSVKSIQEQWKFNAATAHYWAAIAALMKKPILWTPNILLDFICNADADEFKRLARTFYEFRQRVSVPHSSAEKRVYLKDVSLEIPSDLVVVDPFPPVDVPDPLDEDQWRLLKRYRLS